MEFLFVLFAIWVVFALFGCWIASVKGRVRGKGSSGLPVWAIRLSDRSPLAQPVDSRQSAGPSGDDHPRASRPGPGPTP